MFVNEILGDKVVVVIGGDSNYKDKTEENQNVLSRWALRKVNLQLKEEYRDGRKSFVFSWDEKHREIHEEALLQFFDPNKKGLKFVQSEMAGKSSEDGASGFAQEVCLYFSMAYGHTSCMLCTLSLFYWLLCFTHTCRHFRFYDIT